MPYLLVYELNLLMVVLDDFHLEAVGRRDELAVILRVSRPIDSDARVHMGTVVRELRASRRQLGRSCLGDDAEWFELANSAFARQVLCSDSLGLLLEGPDVHRNLTNPSLFTQVAVLMVVVQPYLNGAGPLTVS